MLWSRSKSIIALDIGSSNVKLLEMDETKEGQVNLVNFGMVDLPPEAIVDGSIMNTAAVVDAITELLQRHRVRGKEVVTSVSGHSVIIKRVNLPVMTEEELEESIQWEAEQYIPFDVSEVNIDVQILDERGDEAGQMEVLLVAARKEMINEYVSLIHEVGLTPAVIDVDAFAVANAFEANYDVPDETVVLCNIGASTVNINVLREGVTVFTRDLGMGGRQVTEEIQRTLNISFEQAESMKVGGDERDASAVVPEEILQIVKNLSESIATEIQRSLDFYLSTSTDSAIGHMYLSGGGARTPGLVSAIASATGIEIELMDPFRRINIDERTFNPNFLEGVAPQAAVAVGLALRKAADR
jgi:type IV pilus assembly protein PilM